VASVYQGERVDGQGGEAEFGWATEKVTKGNKEESERAGEAKHDGTLALTGIRC
jgi:hypothetical protein